MSGVLDGWIETTLGEIAEINPREIIKKEAVAKSVPMDKLASFDKKITGFEVKEFKGGCKFKNGDTLLARITPCLENGKTAYVDILEYGEVGFGSTEYIVIREKEKLSDKQFLFYFSISPRFREIAIKLMTGTSGRQRVQTPLLIKTVFLFPPLPEQKAIANILSSFDEKIELLRAQNETLETLVQTIFKEWFVDFKNGESIPISELIDFNPIEKINRKKEYLFFDMKTLSTNSMAAAEGVFKKSNSGTSFREKDTLFAKITPCLENGKTAFVLDLKDEVIARGSTEFIVMRAKDNGSPYFNYCISRDNNFRDYAIQSMTGTSGRQRVPVDRLKTFKIVYSMKNICKFNDIAKPVFEKIKNNSSQIQTLAKTRDTCYLN